MAFATTTDGLGKVGDLLNRSQMTLIDGPSNIKVGNAKALANNLALSLW